MKLIFLFVLLCATSQPRAAGFSLPKRRISEERVQRLVELAGRGQQPLFPQARSVARVSGRPKAPVCKKELFKLDRAMTVSGRLTAESVDTIDPSFAFFRFALGWDRHQIEASRRKAIRQWKVFGADLSDAVFNKDLGGWVSPSSGLVYVAATMDFALAKIADSAQPVPCRNTSMIVGGWIMGGDNVTYSGPGFEKPTLISGESGLFLLYYVFAPGSKFSTKIEASSNAPSGCIGKACTLTGVTTMVDDFHGPYLGDSDGLWFDCKAPPGKECVQIVISLSWPRRKP